MKLAIAFCLIAVLLFASLRTGGEEQDTKAKTNDMPGYRFDETLRKQGEDVNPDILKTFIQDSAGRRKAPFAAGEAERSRARSGQQSPLGRELDGSIEKRAEWGATTTETGSARLGGKATGAVGWRLTGGGAGK